jgi:hypothetical protein
MGYLGKLATLGKMGGLGVLAKPEGSASHFETASVLL